MTSHQTPVDELLRHYKTDPARGLTAEQHIGDPTETSIIVAAHKKRAGAGRDDAAVPAPCRTAVRLRPQTQDKLAYAIYNGASAEYCD